MFWQIILKFKLCYRVFTDLFYARRLRTEEWADIANPQPLRNSVLLTQDMWLFEWPKAGVQPGRFMGQVATGIPVGKTIDVNWCDGVKESIARAEIRLAPTPGWENNEYKLNGYSKKGVHVQPKTKKTKKKKAHYRAKKRPLASSKKPKPAKKLKKKKATSKKTAAANNSPSKKTAAANNSPTSTWKPCRGLPLSAQQETILKSSLAGLPLSTYIFTQRVAKLYNAAWAGTKDPLHSERERLLAKAIKQVFGQVPKSVPCPFQRDPIQAMAGTIDTVEKVFEMQGRTAATNVGSIAWITEMAKNPEKISLLWASKSEILEKSLVQYLMLQGDKHGRPILNPGKHSCCMWLSGAKHVLAFMYLRST